MRSGERGICAEIRSAGRMSVRGFISAAGAFSFAALLSACQQSGAETPSLALSAQLAPTMVAQAAAPAEAAVPAKDFNQFLAALRTEASGRGIRAETLNQALNGIEPIPRVIELDRRQPEFTMTFPDYIGRAVSAQRIERGKRAFAENAKLLEQIGQKYGVQPRFIVALWGLETNYGQNLGSFPIIAALATLAFDGRRSAFFRRELFHALTIVDKGHITAAEMRGSWAGAMGQPQFMPSSFVNFAQDWDGDGRQDIWKNQADVFASAANYLAKSGWNSNETWGRAVRLPAGFDVALIGLEVKKSVVEWQKLGVRLPDGKALPSRADMQASLVKAASTAEQQANAPTFLVYENFRTIMKWNRSIFYALAAGHLADHLATR